MANLDVPPLGTGYLGRHRAGASASNRSNLVRQANDDIDSVNDCVDFQQKR
jgi:hypothetical protein